MTAAVFTTYKYYLSHHPSCGTLDICGLEQMKWVLTTSKPNKFQLIIQGNKTQI